MNHIRAIWIGLRAMGAYVSEKIDEAEFHRQINEARALVGREPVGRESAS